MGKHVECRYEKTKARRVVQVLDMIHSELIGPLPTPSYGSSRYVFTFINDFSRYCCVYFLKLQYEFFETFKVHKALVDSACGNNTKVLRTNNVKDYVNKIL